MGREALIDWGRKLRTARRAAAKAPEIERSLRDLALEATSLKASITHHRAATSAEEADVDRLDGVGGLVGRLTGTWKERVDREVREALAARERLDRVLARAAEVDRELASLRSARTRLADVEPMLANVALRVEEALRALKFPRLAELEALDAERDAWEEASERVGGALRACLGAIAAVGTVVRDLSDIRGLAAARQIEAVMWSDVRRAWQSRSVWRNAEEAMARCRDFERSVADLGAVWRAPEAGTLFRPLFWGAVLGETMETLDGVTRLVSGDLSGGLLGDGLVRRSNRAWERFDALTTELDTWVEPLGVQHRAALARLAAIAKERLDWLEAASS